MNLSLFPKNEQWLTGEESSDVRLTKALHQTLNSLSFESIREFEKIAREIKPRIGQQQFIQNVNFTLKALIGLLNPEAFINEEWQKYLGNFNEKKLIHIQSPNLIALEKEILDKGYVRLLGVVDFKLITNKESEFNPFIDFKLKLSQKELSVRVIFKEFKEKLANKSFEKKDELFFLLQEEQCVYQFPEGLTVWTDHSEIYAFL